MIPTFAWIVVLGMADPPALVGPAPAHAFGPDGAEIAATIERTGEARPDGAGDDLRFVLKNAGVAPIDVARVVLVEGAPLAEPRATPLHRVLRFAPGVTEGRVTGLASRVDSRCLIAAAMPDGSRGVVALARCRPEVATTLALERAEGDGLALSAECAFEPPLHLAPGAAAELPGIDVISVDDALRGIGLLLGDAPADAEPQDGAPAFVLPDGAAQPQAQFGGWRPADLFAGDGHPEVLVRPTGSGARVRLSNRGFEADVRGASLRAIGLDASAIVRARAGEVDLGLFRRAVMLPMAPRETLEIALAPAEPPPGPLGWEWRRVFPIGPAGSGANVPAEVKTLDAADPTFEGDVEQAFGINGVVLANLRSADCLEPLPQVIADKLVARIVPARARAGVATPEGALERFTRLASNVEYVVDFPTQPPQSPAWLVCHEAGFYATPLQPRIVDGAPAARGFVVLMRPGGLVVTLGLSPAEFDALAAALADRKLRNDFLRKASTAVQAVRLDRTPSGLFAAFRKLKPISAGDLVPADPIVMRQWSATLPAVARTRLHALQCDGGGRATEEVIEFSGNLNFAVDVPQPASAPVILVLRRLPAPPGLDRFLLDQTPLEPIAATALRDGFWSEEFYRLTPELLAGRQRVLLTLSDTGMGDVSLARIGFFQGAAAKARFENDGREAIALTSLPLAKPASVADGYRYDACLDGTPLLVRDRAFEDGIQLRAGCSLEFDLGALGRPCSRLLAFAGVHRDEPAAGGAKLRIVVDGEERFAREFDPYQRPEEQFAIDVKGARRLVIEAVQREAGIATGAIVLGMPRLTAGE